MIDINVKVTGDVAVVARLEGKYPLEALSRLRRVVHAAGLLIERKVKLEKLNGQILRRRTGRLARSINTRVTDTATSSTATVGTNVKYGVIWELTGSKAFRIMPVNKKALFWKGAAYPVASVLRPAQAARPFLRPALEESRPTIRAMIDRAMKEPYARGE